MRRTAIIAISVFAVLLAVLFGARHVIRVLDVASSYYAKVLCSAVFVSGWDPGFAIVEDVQADLAEVIDQFDAHVDRERGVVTASLYGRLEHQALFRPGLGCTLVTGTTTAALRAQARDFAPDIAFPPEDKEWPEGRRVTGAGPGPGVDRAALTRALDRAFAEPNPRSLARTRAVVVVHKGRIVAERYMPSIGADTPLAGWSLAKTAINALTGVLVRDGKLALDRAALLPAWREAGDPRAAITLRDLLQMTSGLNFDDPRSSMRSDARLILFQAHDAAAYAEAKRLAAAPGNEWFYSTGPAVLLSKIQRQAVGGSQALYFQFPRRALFNPLGMTSAVLEADPSGTFLGDAFMFASARDWARLGLLYLNDGVWRGKRLLPEGWVRFSTTPTTLSGGQYGALLWRRIPDFLRPTYSRDLPLPEDSFFMLGNDGQIVAVIPSRDLVVVRLGLSRHRRAWDHEAFLYELLKAFPAARS